MKNYLDLLKKMVEIKSLTGDSQSFDCCIETIRNYLGADFIFQKIESNGFCNYVVSRQKIKNFDVLLYGHLDIVEAADSDFIVKEKGGKLFGRGVFDMKSGIAIFVEILKNYAGDLNVGLMLVSDEETGGENGTNAVLNKGFFAKCVLIPDGGFGTYIVESQKGVMFYKFSCEGAGGHGSRPWKSLNPVVTLFNFYQGLLKDLKIVNNKPHRGVTANLGVVRAGEKVNQIPLSAEIKIDFRFTEAKDRIRIEKYIDKKKKQLKMNVELITDADFFSVDKNDRSLKLFKKIVDNVYKKKFPLLYETGGSDAHYFSHKNITAIVFQPLGGNNHQAGEWVDIKSLQNFKLTVEKFINEFKQR